MAGGGSWWFEHFVNSSFCGVKVDGASGDRADRTVSAVRVIQQFYHVTPSVL